MVEEGSSAVGERSPDNRSEIRRRASCKRSWPWATGTQRDVHCKVRRINWPGVGLYLLELEENIVSKSDRSRNSAAAMLEHKRMLCTL